MPKELVTASDAAFALVVKEAVEPCLRQVAEEQSRNITVMAHQWTPAGEGPAVEVSASTTDQHHPPARGVARLRFRTNYGGDRLHFLAEAHWPHSSKGFAGFEVEGRVELEGDSAVRVDYGAWAATWSMTSEYRRWP